MSTYNDCSFNIGTDLTSIEDEYVNTEGEG